VLQGITGKSMTYLTKVTLPYLFIMMAFVILIAVFPGIVLWFPKLVLGR
jgi:TRAP-type C4-dicarboxylate transport system permease large subunit